MSNIMDHAIKGADKAFATASTSARDLTSAFDIVIWSLMFLLIFAMIYGLFFYPDFLFSPIGPQYGYGPHWRTNPLMQNPQYLQPQFWGAGQGGIVGMDEQSATQLTSSITQAAAGFSRPPSHPFTNGGGFTFAK